jgi:hypothetical protein
MDRIARILLADFLVQVRGYRQAAGQGGHIRQTEGGFWRGHRKIQEGHIAFVMK